MIRDIQDEIMRLKKENDVCILAHLYQNDAILEVADYTGDSFALAKLAQTVPNKTVLMCGVRFMAETVKMLAPDKRVLLSNPDAGCPMAEQMDREVIEQVKEITRIILWWRISTPRRSLRRCAMCALLLPVRKR